MNRLVALGGSAVLTLSVSCATYVYGYGIRFGGETGKCTLANYWGSYWFFLSLLGMLASLLVYRYLLASFLLYRYRLWCIAPFITLVPIAILLFCRKLYVFQQGPNLLIVLALFFCVALCAQSTTELLMPLQWDVFISHASEDKEDFVKPLAKALEGLNLRVWYDNSTLTLGDNLKKTIYEGLRSSKFGIVVLSHAFLKKTWPQEELNGLLALERCGRKVILPICHKLTKAEIPETLKNRIKISSSEGLPKVVAEIIRATNKGESASAAAAGKRLS